MLRRVLVLMTLVGLSMSMMAMTGCHHKKHIDDAGKETKDTTTITRPPAGNEMVAGMPVVYFDFDKYEIRADQQANVDKDVDFLKANPTAKIRIEGNCDERGTIEYNLGLGEKRAKTLLDYMAGHGIAKDRMSVLSRGKENPADMGKTDAAYAKNRRDEYFYTAK